MAIDLMQTAIDPDNGGVPPTRNTKQALENVLGDLQGNILKSHGRDHSRHLFITFNTADPTARKKAREWLAEYATQATSAMKQWQEAKIYRAVRKGTGKNADTSPTADDGRQAGAVTSVFVSVLLSAHAYQDLRLGPGYMPDDPCFALGAKKRADFLHDPLPAQWEATFQRTLHALVILADDHPTKRLDSLAQKLQAGLSAIGATVTQETGAAMRLDEQGKPSPTAPVREHFGFVDGISQPLFFASDIERARTSHGGIDRYDPSAPLGQVLVKDPGGGPDGYGSYFVYRKLEQDVTGFRKGEKLLATKIAEHARGASAPTEADIALAGGYMVGRFRDGTPVVDRDVPGLSGLPNNFNFDADPDGVRCPLQAHARQSNPRGDKQRQFGVPVTQERSRRIARRAISYGPATLTPDSNEKVGLLFLCAQSSIADQFEFIQAAWANNEDFLRNDTGLDPVIGTSEHAKASTHPGGQPGAESGGQPWPKQYGSRNELDFSPGEPPPPRHTPWYFRQQVSGWVSMRGGEYFFAPSISALKKFGTVVESQAGGH